MPLCPHPLPSVPEATVAAVQGAFPTGHLSVELRAEFGSLDEDQRFADLYPPATTPDGVMGPTLVHDLAARALLPGPHWRASGSVEADFLVTAQTQHHIDVVGPAFGS